MPLGMEVGLGPRDFVLDGYQLPPPKKGAQHQDTTCYGGWHRPRQHCKMGTQFPLKRAQPQFLAIVHCGQMVAHLSYCSALVLTVLKM